MEVKHTPGPWKFGYGPDQCISIIGTRSDVAWVFNPAAGLNDTSRSYAEDEANARLICAAPELLEALTDAVIDFDNWAAHEDNHPHEHLVAWAEKARAAIAKAKGEDQ